MGEARCCAACGGPNPSQEYHTSAREQTGQPYACDGGEEAKGEPVNHRAAA
jgi:hypothetical protein